jgi:hypothetical protein
MADGKKPTKVVLYSESHFGSPSQQQGHAVMWAPIAAVLFAFGVFNTPGDIQAEQQYLAQQSALQEQQFQCAETEMTKVDISARKTDKSGAC